MKNSFKVFFRTILTSIIISFFLCLEGFTQNQPVIDSLKQLIVFAKQDTNNIKLLMEIGRVKPDVVVMDFGLKVSQSLRSPGLSRFDVPVIYV